MVMICFLSLAISVSGKVFSFDAQALKSNNRAAIEGAVSFDIWFIIDCYDDELGFIDCIFFAVFICAESTVLIIIALPEGINNSVLPAGAQSQLISFRTIKSD